MELTVDIEMSCLPPPSCGAAFFTGKDAKFEMFPYFPSTGHIHPSHIKRPERWFWPGDPGELADWLALL